MKKIRVKDNPALYQRLHYRVRSAKSSNAREHALRALHRRFRTAILIPASQRSARRKQTLILWRRNNPSSVRSYSLKRSRKIKLLVLTHYSNGKPKCACCPVTEVAFLTIDHIEENGATDRDSKGRKYTGSLGYRRLIREGFPLGFRVLCFNCNCALYYTGSCPHGTRLTKSIRIV